MPDDVTAIVTFCSSKSALPAPAPAARHRAAAEGLTAMVHCAPADKRAGFRIKLSYAMMKLMLSKRPVRIAANMKRAHSAKTDGICVCVRVRHLEGGQVLNRIRTWSAMSHSP